MRGSIRELGKLGGSLVSAPPEVAEQLAAPLQRQAELLEQILQRQLEFERDLVGRMVAPSGALLHVFEQTAAAMRAQTVAYRAAATSFTQIAELVEQQAEMLQLASEAVSGPVSALRGAADELRAATAGEEPDRRKNEPGADHGSTVLITGARSGIGRATPCVRIGARPPRPTVRPGVAAGSLAHVRFV